MKIFASISFVLAAVCGQEFLGMHPQLEVPVYKFQIDSDPSSKFRNVTKAFKIPGGKVFDDFFGVIPEPIHWLFRIGESRIAKMQPIRYQEIKGIAADMNRPTWEVVMANYAYEMSAFCTSIIVKQTNGTLLHGRNLDFSFASDMKKVTYQALWYRGEDYVYESMMFAGNVGIYTGMKPGAFSISENERTVAKGGNSTISKIVSFS